MVHLVGTFHWRGVCILPRKIVLFCYSFLWRLEEKIDKTCLRGYREVFSNLEKCTSTNISHILHTRYQFLLFFWYCFLFVFCWAVSFEFPSFIFGATFFLRRYFCCFLFFIANFHFCLIFMKCLSRRFVIGSSWFSWSGWNSPFNISFNKCVSSSPFGP